MITFKNVAKKTTKGNDRPAASKYSADWLNAVPVITCRFHDDAVGLRLG